MFSIVSGILVIPKHGVPLNVIYSQSGASRSPSQHASGSWGGVAKLDAFKIKQQNKHPPFWIKRNIHEAAWPPEGIWIKDPGCQGGFLAPGTSICCSEPSLNK